MTVYRGITEGWFAVGDREVHISVGQEWDDEIPAHAEVIARWGGRGSEVLRAPNIEAATAAPGEQRSTRRKPAA